MSNDKDNEEREEALGRGITPRKVEIPDLAVITCRWNMPEGTKPTNEQIEAVARAQAAADRIIGRRSHVAIGDKGPSLEYSTTAGVPLMTVRLSPESDNYGEVTNVEIATDGTDEIEQIVSSAARERDCQLPYEVQQQWVQETLDALRPHRRAEAARDDADDDRWQVVHNDGTPLIDVPINGMVFATEEEALYWLRSLVALPYVR